VIHLKGLGAEPPDRSPSRNKFPKEKGSSVHKDESTISKLKLMIVNLLAVSKEDDSHYHRKNDSIHNTKECHKT
jgi:hypothetical protein